MKGYHLVFLVVAAALAHSAGATTITYNFWLEAPNGYPVTDLVLYASDGSQDDVYLSPVELSSSGVFKLEHTLAFDPKDALVLGITERDKDDWWDIIVFTSDAYAVAALGQRYDALFPKDSDSNLGHNEISPLMQAAHAGDLAALYEITTFLRGPDAAAAYFYPLGSYSIIQFSQVLPPIGGDLPTPTTLLLIGLGMAGIGCQRLRSAKAA